MTNQELMLQALDARKNAYAPYSRFTVGAALLASDGQVYLGCNVENAAYSPSVCAERTAFVKAMSDGKRAFAAIAIVGGPEESILPGEAIYPCGVCRQVLMEFCRPDFRVLVGTGPESYTEHTLQSLLPHGFGPHNLA